MKTAHFDSQLAWGGQFEVAFSRWLGVRDTWNMPVYERKSDTPGKKGPRLFKADRQLISPDLLGWCGGKPFWWEVKRKTSSSVFRKTASRDTGIAEYLLNDYHAVQIVTLVPVWLIFGHEEQDEVIGAPIADLGEGRLSIMDGQRMRFWPCASMRRLASFAEVMAYADPLALAAK